MTKQESALSSTVTEIECCDREEETLTEQTDPFRTDAELSNDEESKIQNQLVIEQSERQFIYR